MGYYENERAKVMIAMDLEKLGWNILGWKDDESDYYTDYYSPASWNGIATKNGYVVVVDNDSDRLSESEIRKWVNGDPQQLVENKKLYDKIIALRRMTVANNASPAEEATAKEKIALMEQKLAEDKKKASRMQVIGKYPKFQANPRMMKWHVEKDGDILAKGNRLGCYAELKYYDPEEPWKKPDPNDFNPQYYDGVVERSKQSYEEKKKLYKQYRQLIKKIDQAAGGIIGQGELTKYKKVKTYKKVKERVTVPLVGKLTYAVGEYFILNSNFTYGCEKGFVYKITEVTDSRMSAQKMDKKLTKVLSGLSNPANFFHLPKKSMDEWLNLGSISMVKIEDIEKTVIGDKLVEVI